MDCQLIYAFKTKKGRWVYSEPTGKVRSGDALNDSFDEEGDSPRTPRAPPRPLLGSPIGSSPQSSPRDSPYYGPLRADTDPIPWDLDQHRLGSPGSPDRNVVRVPMPQKRALQLPEEAVEGRPLTPTFVGFDAAHPRLKVGWARTDAAGEADVLVSRDLTYTPETEDVGCVLMCTVMPEGSMDCVLDASIGPVAPAAQPRPTGNKCKLIGMAAMGSSLTASVYYECDVPEGMSLWRWFTVDKDGVAEPALTSSDHPDRLRLQACDVGKVVRFEYTPVTVEGVRGRKMVVTSPVVKPKAPILVPLHGRSSPSARPESPAPPGATRARPPRAPPQHEPGTEGPVPRLVVTPGSAAEAEVEIPLPQMAMAMPAPAPRRVGRAMAAEATAEVTPRAQATRVVFAAKPAPEPTVEITPTAQATKVVCKAMPAPEPMVEFTPTAQATKVVCKAMPAPEPMVEFTPTAQATKVVFAQAAAEATVEVTPTAQATKVVFAQAAAEATVEVTPAAQATKVMFAPTADAPAAAAAAPAPVPREPMFAQLLPEQLTCMKVHTLQIPDGVDPRSPQFSCHWECASAAAAAWQANSPWEDMSRTVACRPSADHVNNLLRVTVRDAGHHYISNNCALVLDGIIHEQVLDIIADGQVALNVYHEAGPASIQLLYDVIRLRGPLGEVTIPWDQFEGIFLATDPDAEDAFHLKYFMPPGSDLPDDLPVPDIDIGVDREVTVNDEATPRSGTPREGERTITLHADSCVDRDLIATLVRTFHGLSDSLVSVQFLGPTYANSWVSGRLDRLDSKPERKMLLLAALQRPTATGHQLPAAAAALHARNTLAIIKKLTTPESGMWSPR